MFNRNLFKSKIVEKGISIIDLCKELGICEATFYRKISRDGDFSREEIEKTVNMLNLSLEESNNIFFAQKLA